MKYNNFAMKDWHLEHVEKVIVHFAQGLPPDASSFEKKRYKKFGTITCCARQIEYDMKQGVEKGEVTEVFRKITLNKKYAKLRSNAEAIARLEGLKDHLYGEEEIAEDRLLWHRNAYRQEAGNHG